jgi:hypothetical protein
LTAERETSRLHQMTLESRVHEVCARSILFRYFQVTDHPPIAVEGVSQARPPLNSYR